MVLPPLWILVVVSGPVSCCDQALADSWTHSHAAISPQHQCCIPETHTEAGHAPHPLRAPHLPIPIPTERKKTLKSLFRFSLSSPSMCVCVCVCLCDRWLGTKRIRAGGEKQVTPPVRARFDDLFAKPTWEYDWLLARFSEGAGDREGRGDKLWMC